ncbi:DHA2 family efflux MFS transporter permease subunit [Paraburkholderia flava]|uniref:DHA2 family efflux MFS transporter permease subunit n=1 Tax=Paraburkholderia flava TaxID=2547393 RepID=UPI00105CCE3A|nr:DHA2 family efflux MFS transporter permease subunit [Paraburkholderia flava]
MTGAPPHPQSAPLLHGAKLALLTFALSLATFIEVLDSTVTNVAVPSIAGSLGVSNSQASWVISSYSVSAAIAVPLTGWLSNRVGEARLFVIAVLLFTLTSLMCATAPNLEMLVVFRSLQGLSSGPMVPLSQTILLRAFPPQQRVLALALWAMTVLLAPIFGPVFGGWIIDRFSWPWIFFINLPIGVFAFVACTLLLRRDPAPEKRARIDIPGIVLLVVGVGSLQAVLDLGRENGWFDSPMIVTLAVVAALALSSLLIWESAETHPVIDLSLFRDRTFSFGVAIISFGMVAFSVIGVIFPLWMQTVMGYSAFQAGMATAPLGILALVFSLLIGIYLEKIDARVVTSFGFLVFFGVLAWDTAHFTLTMTFQQIVTPMLIQGIGLPCFFIPLTAAIVSRVPDHKLAAASGLSNFLRTLSAAFGTALSVTWWDNRAAFHYGTLRQSVTAASDGTSMFAQSLHDAGLAGAGPLPVIREVVQQQSYMMATNDLFYMACIVCLVLAATMWMTRPARRLSAAGAGH